jgi:hypothetical protein
MSGILINDDRVYKLAEVDNPAAVLGALSSDVVNTILLTPASTAVLTAREAVVVYNMPCIDFNSEWFINEDSGHLVMEYSKGHSCGNHISIGDNKLTWYPPEGMSIALLVHLSVSDGCAREYMNAYLYFIDRETAVAGAPPLPNIYADGKLCTGLPKGTGVTGGSPCLVTAADRVVNAWADNAWNCDLSDEFTNRYKSHFAFTVDGKQIRRDLPTKSLSTPVTIPGSQKVMEAVSNVLRAV